MLVDSDSGVAISRMVENAGIPLVFVTEAPANRDNLPANQAFIGSNEVQAGLDQADFICQELNGEGNVVMMLGLLGTSGQRGRTQGIKEGFAKEGCTNIHIIEEQTANWLRTPSIDLMSNWLSAGLEFQAIISNNDEMALGAIQALKANNAPVEDMVIVGVDGTADGVEAIAAGELDLSMFQNAKAQGEGAVDLMVNMIENKPYKSINWVPFEKITIDNYQNYQAKK